MLGPAIQLAGAAVLIAIAINAFVSFLNLQTYAAFATTLPEAGGGNRWVKMGLGDFQGFMAGWISWLAHAAACGLYALSGGFYLYQFLFSALHIPPPLFISEHAFEKIFALIALGILGWLNWKSNKTTQKAGGVIVTILLAILFLFIVSGFFGLSFSIPSEMNAPWTNNFSNFWSMGIIGIVSAAALFYIAFEGSEIQAQSGEEVTDPKSLKTALFGSWAIVAALYLVIAFIMISYGPLEDLGEGAIISIAKKFMPFGPPLMVVGGVLANLAALNATIFSSSRLAFSLARDKSILTYLARIHSKNSTPDLAVLTSIGLIALMVITLPLVSVAAAASLLFILLFLQLNIAAIAFRKQNPNISWNYRIIGYPLTTVIAIFLYAFLAIATAFVISAAWYVAIFWILLGAINYFAYTREQRRESFNKEVLYEKTLRLGAKKANRILLPIDQEMPFEQVTKLLNFTFPIAAYYSAEIITVTIVPPSINNPAHFRQQMDKISELADKYNEHHKKSIDIHTYVLSNSDVVSTILEIVREEECDILILNWDGYVRSKGSIFGRKIDPVLRKAECDLFVLKTNTITYPASILVAVDFRMHSPFLRVVGKTASAIAKGYGSTITIFTVINPSFKKTDEYARWYEGIDFRIKRRLKLDTDLSYTLKITENASITSAILEESKNYDLLILGAAREKFFAEIRAGGIPEFAAKHTKKPAIIVKGHRGITQPFIDYIIERIRG